jgi:hypothetical protein
MNERRETMTRSPRRTERSTKTKKAPHVPEPSEEKVRRGAPSVRTTYIKDGVPVYRHIDGRNRVRFLAWKDGEHFLFYLWVHRNIGVDKSAYACLLKNWNEPCPVCEDIRKQLDEGTDWDDVKDQGIMLGRNPRILAQVVDRNNEDKGVQIWNVTAFEIDDAITALSIHEDTGHVIPWTSPEKGRDLIYTYDPSSDFAYPKNLTRSDENPVNIDFYNEIIDFEEDVIYKATYDEITEDYFGGFDDPLDDKDTEEPGPTEEELPAEEETSQNTDDEDCFGKDYGKYEDCEPCEDNVECEEKVKNKKPVSPRRR